MPPGSRLNSLLCGGVDDPLAQSRSCSACLSGHLLGHPRSPRSSIVLESSESYPPDHSRRTPRNETSGKRIRISLSFWYLHSSVRLPPLLSPRTFRPLPIHPSFIELRSYLLLLPSLSLSVPQPQRLFPAASRASCVRGSSRLQYKIY